jgi:TolB-like protein/DNA-binding winged helix-turn-helix (wHTH) protein
MDRLTTIPLRIGDWRVDPQLGQLARGSQIERLDARTLRLLLHLANRAGETVSMEELLDNVWSGVVVTQDSVYQAVTQLRRLLGDDAKDPRYIVTVPRLGYRLVAAVSPWPAETLEPLPAMETTPPRRPVYSRRFVGASVAALVIVVMAAFGLLRGDRAPPAKSVAVMPFLDLTTQEMKEEYFADGLTEELIHRLSKLPGFSVPAPTASYYYKDKQLPVTDIGAQLRVRYLLDGSLRESGEKLRISARLVRASDGVVIWSENYDRPKSDRVMIQDDIATKVATAISASLK